MFTTTPQDFFNQATKYAAFVPKTPAEVQAVVDKAKAVVEIETNNAKDVMSVYAKAAKGDASLNEITSANKKVQDLMVSARFASVMSIPGAIFVLPALIEASKKYDFEFVPESVAKEFGI